METGKILFSGSLFRGPTSSSPRNCLNFWQEQNLLIYFKYCLVLFLQTEGVDVKREKCEAFAAGQIASHLINSTKLQSFLT